MTKDKSQKHLLILIYPQESRYVLRKGLHLHSYSKDGIGTLNPTTGMGLDSYSMNVLCCRFVMACWLGKSLVLEIRASIDWKNHLFQKLQGAPKSDQNKWSDMGPL